MSENLVYSISSVDKPHKVQFMQWSSLDALLFMLQLDLHLTHTSSKKQLQRILLMVMVTIVTCAILCFAGCQQVE